MTDLDLRKRRNLLPRMAKHWQYYLLVIPPLLFLFFFNYLPMAGLQVAFKNFNASKGIWGSDWVGMQHFNRFFGAYNFSRILSNTLLLSLYNLAVSFPIPIIFALMLNEIPSKRFQKSVQMVSYAPHFISTVIVVSMLNQFLSLRFGFVNNMLAALGLERVNFLAQSGMFRSIYVWSDVWQHTGYRAVIYIAALSTIDPALYEAAKIDGASRIQRIRYIDIPSLLPTAVILLILDVGRIMNLGVDKILAMQNPANMSVSEVISTHVYNIGIINADFSYASAIGLFNSVINLVLILLVNYIAKKLSDTSLW